jgi:hypothetical protein
MINKFVFLISFIVGMSSIGFSQTESVSKLEETGLWEGLYLKVRLNERLGYYAEHHFRSRNEIDNVTSFVGRPRQFYNRIGLNIFVNKSFEFVIGPAFVVNYSPDPGNPKYDSYTIEPRIWHQYLLKTAPMGRVKIMHQFRFEHRWKRSNDVGSNYDFTNRFRYKIFAYIPLNNRYILPKTWFISPSVEIFMQAGESIAYNPFEDFRTYNGVGYVLNNRVTFFAGHMWTFGQESSGYEYRKSHVFRFNLYLGLDGRKSSNKIPKINLGY